MERYTPSDLPDRLTEKIAVNPDNDCWEWTASRRADGYAQAWDSSLGRVNVAHRTVYQLLVDEIPDGLVLDHLCRVRHCVNPNHLSVVTHRQNVVEAPGSLAPSAMNARKTTCIHGHARFRTDKKTGYRSCLECLRLRAWRRRHGDEPAPPLRTGHG